jgi:hypothetical protein
MVRNESVRFGRHIDIKISYKILQLEIPKLDQILRYLACFQKGLCRDNFEQIHPQSFKSFVLLDNWGNPGLSNHGARRPIFLNPGLLIVQVYLNMTSLLSTILQYGFFKYLSKLDYIQKN